MLDSRQEAKCTLIAVALFCLFLCVGLALSAGLVVVLNRIGAGAPGYLVFGAGMLASFPASFVLSAKLARWLFPAVAPTREVGRS